MHCSKFQLVRNPVRNFSFSIIFVESWKRWQTRRIYITFSLVAKDGRVCQRSDTGSLNLFAPERRWRHCSTGSDSSTGSSEASVWTTGVAQKLAKANAKSTSDMWPGSKRFTRGKNLEEGALLVGARPSNNSESSDTTDTTATTTTTTTMPSKLTAMVSVRFRPVETFLRVAMHLCACRRDLCLQPWESCGAACKIDDLLANRFFVTDDISNSFRELTTLRRDIRQN